MTKRLEILKQSLIKKEQELEAKFEVRFDHQKITNGQPMNDKRNGFSWFAKSEKLDNAIRNQMASIEKTKEAIAKEEQKISQCQDVKEVLPCAILKAIENGLITQWRKFPNRFFVVGVEKGRLIWNKKENKLQYSYASSIPNNEQFQIFRKVAIELSKEIETTKEA